MRDVTSILINVSPVGISLSGHASLFPRLGGHVFCPLVNETFQFPFLSVGYFVFLRFAIYIDAPLFISDILSIYPCWRFYSHRLLSCFSCFRVSQDMFSPFPFLSFFCLIIAIALGVASTMASYTVSATHLALR
jgi:hypothetical protein